MYVASTVDGRTNIDQAAKKLGDVAKPIPAPTSLPDPGDTTLNFDQSQPSPSPDLNDIQRSGKEDSYSQLSGPKGDFAVPTIEELDLMPPTTPHRGGETLALASLDEIISNATYTATFSKPMTSPAAFSPQSTTLLSPHHHFGSLSVRLFYWRVMEVLKDYPKAKQSTIPTNLIGQLLFRDMYFGAQAALGHSFDQTHGNSHCRFIPWHLPSRIDPSTGLATNDYDIDTPDAETWFRRWKTGTTGFPWIDALMRQLKQEGWIHHLGRHAVACFLTRGGAYISWERGAAVFAEWLLDHEPACNAGNWQWLSCTAFYAQFYRCYSPVAFPKKWDPEGAFVRKYCPELARFPTKYIYEPWLAPLAAQKSAGCLIRGDGADTADDAAMPLYPTPMFDFPSRRTICIDAVKTAYRINLYGNDPRVKDGTWRALFADSAEGPTEGKDAAAAGGGDKGAKRIKSGGRGDTGVDEDAREAAALGGENRGGDLGGAGKRKRRAEEGQGTLDGHIARARKSARK